MNGDKDECNESISKFQLDFRIELNTELNKSKSLDDSSSYTKDKAQKNSLQTKAKKQKIANQVVAPDPVQPNILIRYSEFPLYPRGQVNAYFESIYFFNSPNILPSFSPLHLHPIQSMQENNPSEQNEQDVNFPLGHIYPFNYNVLSNPNSESSAPQPLELPIDAEKEHDLKFSDSLFGFEDEFLDKF